MRHVHADAYVLLLMRGETDNTACHRRKTTTYKLHIVSITTHTHDGRKSIGEKKQRKEEKIKEKKGTWCQVHDALLYHLANFCINPNVTLV